MAESVFSPRYKKGYDKTGEGIETFTGLLQGATTDLAGGVVDVADLVGSGVKAVPGAQYMPGLAPFAALAGASDIAGSDVLGEKVFGKAPTELRQQMRDDARLVGGALGLGELATAKAANLIADYGIGPFTKFMSRGQEVAVTPDGQMVPVPPTTDQPLPDTSNTAMLASTDTAGINPEFLPGLKRKEAEAQSRLEAGEDPRKVFEETGFMRINVDARPDRAPGDEPLETKMVFDIPDNLSQIKFSQVLPDNVKTLVGQRASGKQILDSFESLQDSKNYFVEKGYSGGRYGRSVQFKLKDVMSEDHPLFDVFPDLKDEINVRIVEKPPKGSGGFWDSTTNTIAIGADQMGNDRFTSTMFVHEIMHLLQTRGDLPGGSMPFLGPKAVYGSLYDNFAMLESVKFMEGPNFNLNQFVTEGRPKGEQKLLRDLIQKAQFNVKNANPAAPDNLSKMWPGNVNSSAPVDLDNMPYSQEVKAEMFRLIAEKDDRINTKIETLEALGIDPFRTTDGSMESGSGGLIYSDQAQSNYYRTRGEFTARLAEAYALATEGMTPAQRRKLFPMDLAKPNSQSNFIGPSKDAPGGTEGVMGQDLGAAYSVRAGGRGPMEATTFVDPSAIKKDVDEVRSILDNPNLTFPVQTSNYGEYDSRGALGNLLEILEGQLESLPRGEIPPSEMGLVDIGAPYVGEAGGLINVNKLPPEIKSKLEYPQFPQAGIASMVPQATLTPNQRLQKARLKKYGFYQDNPAVSMGESGQEWLRSNQAFAEKRGGDLLNGPVTAILGQKRGEEAVDLFLPSSFVNDLPGANKEVRVAGDPKYDMLMSDVREQGFDPMQKDNRIVIGVNHKGDAFVLEGNTRAAVATDLNIPNVRAEIRYFNGGELVDGPFKPDNMLVKARMSDKRPIFTWHGTGGDFDKFDLRYIGTGEGNQMFGHGIYLSDLEEVGQTYKNQVGLRPEVEIGLEDPDASSAQNYLSDFGRKVVEDENGVQKRFIEETEDNAEILDNINEMAQDVQTNLGKGEVLYEFADGSALKLEYDKSAQGSEGFEVGGYYLTPLGPSEGTLLNVAADINPTTEMLDFYRPLSDQDPQVSEKLQDLASFIKNKELARYVSEGRADGQGVQIAIADYFGVGKDAPEVSELLNKFGIKGMKYSTQGTRYDRLSPEADDYNYVVFDDATLDILKKYGVAGTVGLGTGVAVNETRTTDQPQEMAKGGPVQAGIAEFIQYMQ